MWNQVLSATPNVRYTGGWCLAGVQDAFGTDHPFPTALAQWRGYPQYQHAEYPPAGIDVPIFFSLVGEPAGHVAVRFKDGTVGSTTQAGTHNKLFIHPNIEHLMQTYRSAGWKITYLGWSEVVGTKLVVNKKEEEVKIQNADNWRARMQRLHHQLVGNWDMSEPVFQSIVGQDAWKVVENWSDHENSQRAIQFQEYGERAVNEDWENRLTKTTAELKKLIDNPTVIEKEVVKEVPVPVEVEKIVEKEVVKEVVKGDEQRTAWELILAGLSKVFNKK